MNKWSFRQNGFTRATLSTTVREFAEENEFLIIHRLDSLCQWARPLAQHVKITITMHSICSSHLNKC